MPTFDILCTGPGPHDPPSGILGTSDRRPRGDVRCGSPACAIPPAPSTPQQRVQQRAADSIDALTTLAGSQGVLSPAQLSNAVRVLAKALIALLRITLNRSDVEDGTL